MNKGTKKPFGLFSRVIYHPSGDSGPTCLAGVAGVVKRYISSEDSDLVGLIEDSVLKGGSPPP